MQEIKESLLGVFLVCLEALAFILPIAIILGGCKLLDKIMVL